MIELEQSLPAPVSTTKPPQRAAGPQSESGTVAADRSQGDRPEAPTIWEVGLSVRARNTLGRVHVTDLMQLTRLTRDQVSCIPSLGNKTLDEIEEVMTQYGLAFAQRPGNGLAAFRQPEGDARVTDIVARRRRGESVAQIAAAHGLTSSSVSRILRTAQANGERDLVGRPPRRDEERLADMIARYERGATLDDIGRAYGITRARVDQIFRQAAVNLADMRADRADRERATVAERRVEILNSYRRGDDARMIAHVLALPQRYVAELISREATAGDRRVRRTARERGRENRYTDGELVAAVRAVCERYGRTATTNEYAAAAADGTLPSLPTIHNRLGWATAITLAGYEPRASQRRSYTRRWTAGSCRAALRRLAVETEHVPSANEYDSLAQLDPALPSLGTVRNRLGSWAAATADLARLPSPEKARDRARRATDGGLEPVAIWMAYLEEELNDDELVVLTITGDFVWDEVFGSPPDCIVELLLADSSAGPADNDGP